MGTLFRRRIGRLARRPTETNERQQDNNDRAHSHKVTAGKGGKKFAKILAKDDRTRERPVVFANSLEVNGLQNSTHSRPKPKVFQFSGSG